MFAPWVLRPRFHKPWKSSSHVPWGAVSLAQAAQRLGVSVPRIHQRIADGSLVAERIGSQWVIDERSLLRVQERSKPGRPHSARSAWAVIAVSEKDRDRIGPARPCGFGARQDAVAGAGDDDLRAVLRRLGLFWR